MLSAPPYLVLSSDESICLSSPGLSPLPETVVVVEVHEPEAVVCLSDRGHLVVYIVYDPVVLHQVTKISLVVLFTES